ncbi:9302_t:CDS:1, partial [Paraglomus occultum]
MSLDEFLNNPEEETVYEVPDSDKFIESLIEIYRKPSDMHIVDDNEVDDSVELPI